MRTCYTYFSGGEGAAIGLRDAGYESIGGVEYDPAIAAVAAANGYPLTVADVRTVDPATLLHAAPDWFHASPVCKEFSQAKTGGTESTLDIETAQAVCRFIDHWKPPTVSIENVWGYRRSEAFRAICDCLTRNGYSFDYWHLNAADYGGWDSCPLHVNSVAQASVRGIAPDIVDVAAMMRPADQARILAWDVMVLLVRATSQAIVANAIWQKLESAVRKVQKTLGGVADELWTDVAMSKFVWTDDICASIELLLNDYLDAPLLQTRWSTTSTEIRQITLQKICKSLLTMVSTPQCTTNSDVDPRCECPLCKYTAVPQTRRRLILVARRGLWHIQRPNPTHRESGDMFTPPWIGWYEAIADLVPTLPLSQFAPWQLERLPEYIGETVLVPGDNATSFSLRSAGEPSRTVGNVDRVGNIPRAFIVEGSAAGLDNPYPMQVRGPDEPVFTMRARQNNPRAWLIGSENACQEWGGTRYGDEPAMTISTKQKPRAFLVDGQNAGRDITVLDQGQPSYTVAANAHKGSGRAWLTTGRVVSMTPRALARFQSFPDSYELPSKNALACTVVGNAVPPLLMQRVAEAMQ